jgi:ABC-type lipoprotein release transport system permease subunit
MLALVLIVYAQGFVAGFLESMVNNITKNETGHIRITTDEFYQKAKFMSVTENISVPDKIIEKIMVNEEIAEHIDIITKRVTFGVLLSNEGNNKTAIAFSGDPEVEKSLIQLEKSIMEGGRYLENNKEIIIGRELAKTLKYKIGDKVKVMTQGSDFALHLKKFTVVGIFNSGLNSLDKNVFQIRLDDAQHLLRMGDNVQQIIIMLKDYKMSEQIAKDIALLLNDKTLAVHPWSVTSNNYEYIQMVSSITDFFYFFIALLGVIIIGNIMMMVVMERRHEIGILKSMGISRAGIMGLFLTEGMILGLVGSIVGAVLGIITISLINIKGFDFSTMMKGVEGFPMDNVIYFPISILGLLKVILIGTFVSAIVSVLPSWRASRMNAVDAIKSV